MHMKKLYNSFVVEGHTETIKRSFVRSLLFTGMFLMFFALYDVKCSVVYAAGAYADSNMDSDFLIKKDSDLNRTGKNKSNKSKTGNSKSKKKTKKKSKKKSKGKYGWVKENGEYCYYDRSSGVKKKKCKVDGIKLDKEGNAKKTKYNISKIKTMITARKIVNKITKKSDSKQQKLRKVFDYTKNVRYNKHHTFTHLENKKGFEMIYANDIFEKGDGCCVSQSCALAFLVHECGYKDVYICYDGDHAWVDLKGRVYDPLLARIKSARIYYGGNYSEAHLGAIYKKKI